MGVWIINDLLIRPLCFSWRSPITWNAGIQLRIWPQSWVVPCARDERKGSIMGAIRSLLIIRIILSGKRSERGMESAFTLHNSCGSSRRSVYCTIDGIQQWGRLHEKNRLYCMCPTRFSCRGRHWIQIHKNDGQNESEFGYRHLSKSDIPFIWDGPRRFQPRLLQCVVPLR